MIFPGCEANTDATCLQMIVKKKVTAKNRGGGGGGGGAQYLLLASLGLSTWIPKAWRILWTRPVELLDRSWLQRCICQNTNNFLKVKANSNDAVVTGLDDSARIVFALVQTVSKIDARALTDYLRVFTLVVLWAEKRSTLFLPDHRKYGHLVWHFDPLQYWQKYAQL